MIFPVKLAVFVREIWGDSAFVGEIPFLWILIAGLVLLPLHVDFGMVEHDHRNCRCW